MSGLLERLRRAGVDCSYDEYGSLMIDLGVDPTPADLRELAAQFLAVADALDPENADGWRPLEEACRMIPAQTFEGPTWGEITKARQAPRVPPGCLAGSFRTYRYGGDGATPPAPLSKYRSRYCTKCQTLCHTYEQGLVCNCAQPWECERYDDADYPPEWVECEVTIGPLPAPPPEKK